MCLSSMENFTRYMYKNVFGVEFRAQFFHKKIFETLDKVFSGEITRLIINIPPRYSKTEIAVKMFIAKGLAMNPSAKFMHLSYSDDLALDNSQFVRQYVTHEAYKALFPNVKLQADNNSKKKWYTTWGGGVYATSSGGQVTGFGAGAMDNGDDSEFDIGYSEERFAGALVIDDPLKPEDADSDINRERINQRFDSTMKTRLNSMKTPVILIMQRLHERDLAGVLIERGGWEVISFPVFSEDYPEKVLWPEKHSLEYLLDEQKYDPFMFERQYMQNPTPREGRMYGTFPTYKVIPITKKAVRKNYTDVADKGKDYLCSICYVETEIGLFVTDMVYTQTSTMNTETMVIEMLNRNQTEQCYIESNAGGEIYARNIKDKLRQTGNWKTQIIPFFNTQNKESRIIANAAEVSNMIHFVEGWALVYPMFYSHVSSYRRIGKNAFDDAADTLTGMIEKARMGDSSLLSFGVTKRGSVGQSRKFGDIKRML